jgi:hypothetical protein
MSFSIYDKVSLALKQAENHNSSLMAKPEVILWPDPECQWVDVISVLQSALPQLLIYGNYDPSRKQGPAIWLKCLIAMMLPEADWDRDKIPIIYLPGIAKSDLRNVENAVFNFQPLLEYQYTGTLFTQDNGKEWSILAFVENSTSGLGVKVAQDSATKEALKKTLPTIFQDPEVLVGKSIIDAAYLNNQLFPDIIPAILKWMCKGDDFMHQLDPGRREVFKNLCLTQYDFEPDPKNIKAIAEKLGSKRNSWQYVWQYYANAPAKFPEIEALLRMAKPADLGEGIYAFPKDSWPQINDDGEDSLFEALQKIAKLDPIKALDSLRRLETEHGPRRKWVWYELSKCPLADALQHLAQMAAIAHDPFPHGTLHDLTEYYTSKGYQADQFMRKSLAAVKLDKDKQVIKSILKVLYLPWIESLTDKFQRLVSVDSSIFTKQALSPVEDDYLLFVDAFRFELAKDFMARLDDLGYKVELKEGWSTIPSLTPTSKPNVSPVATMISMESRIDEFRPSLKNGKELQTPVFRDALQDQGYRFVSNSSEIDPKTKCWQEIGDIDTKGHQDQSDMVRRIEDLFDLLLDTIETAFERGVKRIKIVTDHGWLLVPGGLPKTSLNVGLTETRWGRCALIKEGVQTDLLHLPWRWNPSIYIAYAPGISFFKANVEYAHGGISIHECLVPTLVIENPVVRMIEAEIKAIKWVNLKCTIQTSEVPDGYQIDIRTKYNDPKKSIVLSSSKMISGNSVTLMVDDSAESQAATVVLLDDKERILDKKPTTVGG